MTLEDLYSNPPEEDETTSRSALTAIFQIASDPVSSAPDDWDEALELIRWGDDGGANLD